MFAQPWKSLASKENCTRWYLMLLSNNPSRTPSREYTPKKAISLAYQTARDGIFCFHNDTKKLGVR
jgi:hypothetical protein